MPRLCRLAAFLGRLKAAGSRSKNGLTRLCCLFVRSHFEAHPVRRLIVSHTDCINRLKIRPVTVTEVKSLPPCIPESFDGAFLVEGLPQAVARLVRRRALQRVVVVGA